MRFSFFTSFVARSSVRKDSLSARFKSVRKDLRFLFLGVRKDYLFARFERQKSLNLSAHSNFSESVNLHLFSRKNAQKSPFFPANGGF